MTWLIFDLFHFSIPASVSHSCTDLSSYPFDKILQNNQVTLWVMNWFGVKTISKFEYWIACSLNSLQLTNINNYYLICHLWRRTTQTTCSAWWNNLICLHEPGLIKSRWFYPLPIFRFSPVHFATILNIINHILHTFRGKKVSKEPEG